MSQSHPEQAYEGLVWMPARRVGATRNGYQDVEFETAWGRTLRWSLFLLYTRPGAIAVAIDDYFKDRVRVRAYLDDGSTKRTWVRKWWI
jgi:hypothetical protein